MFAAADSISCRLATALSIFEMRFSATPSIAGTFPASELFASLQGILAAISAVYGTESPTAALTWLTSLEVIPPLTLMSLRKLVESTDVPTWLLI